MKDDLTKIWEAHKPALAAFISKQIEDKALQQDLIQEVWNRTLNALQAHQKIENPKAWLFQVTRNTINDHFRKVYRKAPPQINNDASSSANTNCVCDLTAFVIRNYLPQIYAEPLIMSDLEQRSQKDIAAELGIGYSTLKSRIQRGRKILKDKILHCVDIKMNDRGEVVDYDLKPGCEIPPELMEEMRAYKIML